MQGMALFLIRILQGAIIGGGAILPGISGGVLAVSFGVYEPMMRLLAHPRQEFRKYWRMFLPIGIGWLLGFFVFAALISWFFDFSHAVSTALIIGLIAGTFPSLFADAGKRGHTPAAWTAFTVTLLAAFGVLAFFSRSDQVAAVQPGILPFFLCGVFWGLSVVIPGLTSSSILIAIGLFQPLMDAVAKLDLAALIPMGLGILVAVAALSRLVSHLFDRHYAVMWHMVLGVVVSSTLLIVPTEFGSVWELLLTLAAFAGGFAASLLLDRLQRRQEEEREKPDGESGE